MSISFDSTEQALRTELVRNTIKSLHKQAAELKTGGPHKEPPHVPPVNPNPRKHDVVAWRHDGARLDTTRHDTKEAAIEYGRALPWVTYYKYAILCGRDIIERHNIAIPDGMTLNDEGMPCAL